MKNVIDGYVASLRVGEGSHFGKMTVLPVFRDGVSPLRYRVLWEALADGSVEVREKDSASVPELWLVNKSAEMVLVTDGEEVVGGMQNRIVNASFLIGAHSEVNVLVSCVEHGRWHDVAPRFHSGEASFHSMRRAKEAQVRQNLRSSGRADADQGAIWEAVADKAHRVGVDSPTGAMNDIYEKRAANLADYERHFAPVDGAQGMVVSLGGSIVGADIFDQARTANKLWGKLVRSYGMDALDVWGDTAVSPETARTFMSNLVGGRQEVFSAQALGQDVRIEGAGLTAAALAYENTVVHLAVFVSEDVRHNAHSGGIARSNTRRFGNPNHRGPWL